MCILSLAIPLTVAAFSILLMTPKNYHNAKSTQLRFIPLENRDKAFREIGMFIDKEWVARYGTKPKYICDYHYLLPGLISLYSREHSRLHVIPHCSLRLARWIDHADLHKHGLVVIAHQDKNIEQETQQAAYDLFDKGFDATVEIPIDNKGNRVFLRFYGPQA